MKRCGIYLLTNRNTGRRYVGQSIDIDGRLKSHERGGSGAGVIGNAIAKHGWQAFDSCVLELCHRAELDDAERKWIVELGTVHPAGYNLTMGGQQYKEVTDFVRARISEGTKRGLTPEVVAARAAKIRGVPKTAEHRASIAAAASRNTANIARFAALAKHQSEETRAKIAASKIGRKLSETTRALISESKRLRHVEQCAAGIVHRHSEETKAKMAAARRAWHERKRAEVQL